MESHSSGDVVITPRPASPSAVREQRRVGAGRADEPPPPSRSRRSVALVMAIVASIAAALATALGVVAVSGKKAVEGNVAAATDVSGEESQNYADTPSSVAASATTASLDQRTYIELRGTVPIDAKAAVGVTSPASSTRSAEGTTTFASNSATAASSEVAGSTQAIVAKVDAISCHGAAAVGCAIWSWGNGWPLEPCLVGGGCERYTCVDPAMVYEDTAVVVTDGVVQFFSYANRRFELVGAIAYPYERFPVDGLTIAMSNDVVALGVPGESLGLGAVYIYERDASGKWTQTSSIYPDNRGCLEYPTIYFGTSIGIDGDTLIVGAMKYSNQIEMQRGLEYDKQGELRRGSAYIYRRIGSAWVKEAELATCFDDNCAMRHRASYLVSLKGNLAITVVEGSMFAYEFDPASKSWNQREVHLAAIDATDDADNFLECDGIEDVFVFLDKALLIKYTGQSKGLRFYVPDGDAYRLTQEVSWMDTPNDALAVDENALAFEQKDSIHVLQREDDVWAEVATISIPRETYFDGSGYKADLDARQLSIPGNNLFLGKEGRIIDGYDAPVGRYPYSISLEDDNGHFCGGSLIGPACVLTAAHCMGDPFSVRIGSDEVGKGELIGVSSVVNHPDYNDKTDEFDIALVFLEEATTTVTEFAKVNDDSSYPPEGSTVVTMGWGDTDEGDGTRFPSDLQAVELEIISNDDCRGASNEGDSYKDWIYPNMVCTFTKGKDSCQGDSGGPLVMAGAGPRGEDVIIGIVSWGVGCAYLPGVYSRVSEGFGWIEDMVCNDDDTIEKQRTTVCSTPEPTPEPTNVPTRPPSRKPTRNPTQNPTRFPTRSPTKRPTDQPSINPTPGPSASPSASPTLTAAPSLSPTEFPTDSPSISSVPTSSPSASPTESSAPSASPSHPPSTSLRPSHSPSDSPTTSTQPSVAPSISQSPTITSSESPSFSSSPTISSAPTGRPSISTQPSLAPSTFPSGVPTMSSSPTVSSSPTESMAPTVGKSERGDEFGDSLLISIEEAMKDIAGKDSDPSANVDNVNGKKVTSGSLIRMGGSLVYVASGIILGWLLL